MATIHISEADAARDLAGLLAKVRRGDNVLVEDERQPGVVFGIEVRPDPRLSLRQRIDRMPKHSIGVMDEEFARDVQAGIDSHREESLNTSAWD